jgi:hypothetical protein
MCRLDQLFAHVGGLPVEEMAAALLPAGAMLGLGLRLAALRLRRALSLRRPRPVGDRHGD